MITIALPKGRILQDTLPLLAGAGITVLDDIQTTRKLILLTSKADVRVVVVRATDVPTYVQHGAADLGVVGKDVLDEHGGTGLYQLIDLGIACCRMVVATHHSFDYLARVHSGGRIRVATKYVHTARHHFAIKGTHVDFIKLYGSMELAPLVGLADAIVDLVSTGKTLQQNQLKIVEEVRDISARLVVNPATFKLNRHRLQPILDAFSTHSPHRGGLLF